MACLLSEVQSHKFEYYFPFEMKILDIIVLKSWVIAAVFCHWKEVFKVLF